MRDRFGRFVRGHKVLGVRDSVTGRFTAAEKSNPGVTFDNLVTEQDAKQRQGTRTDIRENLPISKGVNTSRKFSAISVYDRVSSEVAELIKKLEEE